MFGMSQNPASAYRQVSNEIVTEVTDPHRLILMLFEGAQTAIVIARANMTDKTKVAEKGEAISKAINIITNGLRASLNVEEGGELAERLLALYDYICRRLLWANLKNDLAALDEAKYLLTEVHSAWTQITPSEQSPNAVANKDAA